MSINVKTQESMDTQGSGPSGNTPSRPDVQPVKKQSSFFFYVSAVILGVIVLLALFANFLPLAGPGDPIGPSRLAPQFGSLDTLLGTDAHGRSTLSRVIAGGQVSLVVGGAASLTGMIIGSLIGLTSGYLRGRFDGVVGLLVDAMLAFPPLILLLALASILTPSMRTLLLGLSLLSIPVFVRLARSATIAACSREYVRAAVNMGASDIRILFREILPNIISPLLAYLPVVAAAMIVAEGSLSFLNLGIPPPQPSWGGMISEGSDAIATEPWLVAFPSLALFMTVFSLNQLGDYLRARSDVNSR